ncbi:MAG: 2-oxo-4-hydroxy-4-carboxy-5-ureidoimidazoline decarboxylase [Janthinobacterium lividum]
MSYIEQWNSMPAQAAADAVLPCCGSHAWAAALVARRPLSTLPELLAASDAAWWGLPEDDWREAFNSHPRIGERHARGAASAKSVSWSGAEQSGVTNSADDTAARLAEGNRAYEQKFGLTFIVRATGKTAEDILEVLEGRMTNTPEAELHEAAEQQREITHIRLRRWLVEHEGADAE